MIWLRVESVLVFTHICLTRKLSLVWSFCVHFSEGAIWDSLRQVLLNHWRTSAASSSASRAGCFSSASAAARDVSQSRDSGSFTTASCASSQVRVCSMHAALSRHVAALQRRFSTGKNWDNPGEPNHSPAAPDQRGRQHHWLLLCFLFPVSVVFTWKERNLIQILWGCSVRFWLVSRIQICFLMIHFTKINKIWCFYF